MCEGLPAWHRGQWSPRLEYCGLPQGAPSSPIVANLVATSVDRWVHSKLRGSFPDARYSRYADEIVVSTRSEDPSFLVEAPRWLALGLARSGFTLNRAKTRLWGRANGPLELCGARLPFTDQEPIVPRRRLARRLRVAMHRAREAGSQADPRDVGLLAYAYSLTGDPRWLAGSSAARLRALAVDLVGEGGVQAFLDGWAR